MSAVVLVWTVAFFFANLFQCLPLWISWTAFGSTSKNCINTNAMYLAQAWSDVLTDCKDSLASRLQSSNYETVIILTLPLPCVGPPSLSTLASPDSVTDLGNAIACQAQDCCEWHVPSRRIVSCETSRCFEPCLSGHRTVGAGIAKLVFFNIVVQGARQSGRYQCARC